MRSHLEIHGITP